LSDPLLTSFLYSLTLTNIPSVCDTCVLPFLAPHSQSCRRGKPGDLLPLSLSYATMSCQPFQLTDFGSQSSDVSDSDESVDSTTMEQSTDPHVATLAEPRLSKVCDVCHFLATREYDPGFYPHSSSDWQKFSRIRSSALAGRPCCRIIVDAIETWLRHANHKAYKAVHLGSGLLFNTLDVHLYIHRTGRYTLRPVVSLRWQRDNDGLEAEILRLIIFAPHGMQKRAIG
jgi:hypothetical protein